MYVLSAPWRVVGDSLRFGIGSVIPVTAATSKAGPAIKVGRGPMALLIAR